MALPKKLIGEFFKRVKKVYIIEELDPFWKKISGLWDLDQRREEPFPHLRGTESASR